MLLKGPDGIVRRQKVIYEFRPFHCSRCLRFGHLASRCGVTESSLWLRRDVQGTSVASDSFVKAPTLAPSNIVNTSSDSFVNVSDMAQVDTVTTSSGSSVNVLNLDRSDNVALATTSATYDVPLSVISSLATSLDSTTTMHDSTIVHAGAEPG